MQTVTGAAVEKVARALVKQHMADGKYPTAWEDLGILVHQYYLRQARAAIEAMRDSDDDRRGD